MQTLMHCNLFKVCTFVVICGVKISPTFSAHKFCELKGPDGEEEHLCLAYFPGQLEVE